MKWFSLLSVTYCGTSYPYPYPYPSTSPWLIPATVPITAGLYSQVASACLDARCGQVSAQRGGSWKKVTSYPHICRTSLSHWWVARLFWKTQSLCFKWSGSQLPHISHPYQKSYFWWITLTHKYKIHLKPLWNWIHCSFKWVWIIVIYCPCRESQLALEQLGLFNVGK